MERVGVLPKELSWMVKYNKVGNSKMNKKYHDEKYWKRQIRQIEEIGNQIQHS